MTTHQHSTVGHCTTVGPPRWLVLATGALAALSFGMAIAETSWWMHYLIDDGEYVSLAGLTFITIAGVWLFTRRQLAVSLPLALPWLLFPVITQGDQLIDNLSINWMRLITHVLLAALFAAPVAVVVWAAVLGAGWLGRAHRAWRTLPGLRAITEGRCLEGAATLTAALLALEILVAMQALGKLMIATLVLLIVGTLAVGSRAPADGGAPRRLITERMALGLLLASALTALGLFVGFKHRPGAYQGSPSYFMDPSRAHEGFRLDRVPVGTRPPALPADPEAVRAVLLGYVDALEQLVAAYYILDRNYTFDFHNHLFLRNTPVLPNYRAVATTGVERAAATFRSVDERAGAARAGLAPDDPLGALLDDVRAYLSFNFGRAPTLASMSAGFVQTQAGLQHAAHLYEGEGKVVTARFGDVLAKHRSTLAAPVLAPVVGEFADRGRVIAERYANRIVGF